MRIRYPWIALALAALCALPLAAQQEVRVASGAYRLPPLRLVANTSVVSLDVVVRNPDGSTIAGLTQADFRVLDNGKLRPLSAFTVETGPVAPTQTPAAAASASAPVPSPAAAAATARAIVLFFDDVNTTKADLGNARIAALRFVHEDLGPGDRVAIATASAQPGPGFTHDPTQLAAAIARIAPHPRQSATGLDLCPRITPYEAYGIVTHTDPGALNAALAEKQACDVQQGIVVSDGSQIYEAGKTAIPGSDNQSEQVIAQAAGTWEQARVTSQSTLAALRDAVDLLGREPGSRMVLLASGGFLGMGETLELQQEHIADEALRAGVVINSLDARGLYAAAPGREITYTPVVNELPLPTVVYEEESRLTAQQAAQQAMASLAQTTGGLYFHDSNDLTLGFQRLGMVPAVRYSLAFASGDVARDGKYHKLKVELAQKSHGLIQARPGYFAPAPEAAATTLPDLMDAAMRADTPQSGVAAFVTASPAGRALTVAIHLDTGNLPLPASSGRHRQNLYFIAGLFNPSGAFVAGKRAEMDLALTDATWKRFLAQGLSAKLSLDAPPGPYRLRVVVAEASDAALYATSQSVTLP
ncbi:MAG TPA: VWA domain-containing protein [Terriglobales bacterium]|nr:VWA domain-containing protein [Terriglobales bacterium]